MNLVPWSICYNELFRKGFFSSSGGNYIWLAEMEWLSHEAVLQFVYDDDMNTKVKPFAMNGHRDYWGWLDTGTKESELTVVFCPSDGSEGVYYAQNFICAIYRQIIEFLCQNNFLEEERDSWRMSHLGAIQQVNQWVEAFGNYFSSDWLIQLKELTTRNLKLYDDKETGEKYLVFIFPDEAQEILNHTLNYEKQDESFYFYE